MSSMNEAKFSEGNSTCGAPPSVLNITKVLGKRKRTQQKAVSLNISLRKRHSRKQSD
jgi:hypothetical protein